MPSPLVQAGAIIDPSHYAPLHINRFFTGMWTNRNPLREAAVPHLYEKFYAGSRFESVIGGLNGELTSRLTWARRPGHSIYNSQTFPAVNRFFEFRKFQNGSEIIRVMADCVAAVFDATGPSTKQTIWTKSAGAGSTFFQDVGNTLFMGNGVDNVKWLNSTKVWAAGAAFSVGDWIVDTNFNLQQVTAPVWAAGYTYATNVIIVDANGNLQKATVGGTTGTGAPPWNTTVSGTTSDGTVTWTNLGPPTTGGSQPAWNTSGTTTDNIITWTYRGPAVTKWGIAAPTMAPVVSMISVPSVTSTWSANTFYNPSLLIVDSNNNFQKLTATAWAATTAYALNTTIVDANGNVQKATTGGTSGSATPSWNTTVNGTTTDGTVTWTNLGIPTTGNSQPTWNAVLGGTTTDGTVIWTNKGTAVWAQNKAYNAGDIVAIGWCMVDPHNWANMTTYWSFFQCVTPGTSNASPPTYVTTGPYGWDLTGNGSVVMGIYNRGGSDDWPYHNIMAPRWTSTVGSYTADGSVLWQNIGPQAIRQITNGLGWYIGWQAPANQIRFPNWTSIGANTPCSAATSIVDSVGNKQTLTQAGKSGSSAPAWNPTLGGLTPDNTVVWTNAGPVYAIPPNTSPWTYAYGYKSSITKHVSTASPSVANISPSGNSYPTLSAPACSDPLYDTVQIYRTVQGGATLMLLAEIAMPAAGSYWSYEDRLGDAALNPLILANVAHSADPPPAGTTALAYHASRVWAVVGNTLYYSQAPGVINGNGLEAFPPLNSFSFPSMITRCDPTAIGLLVYTVSDIFIIKGQGTSSQPFYPLPFVDGYGLLHYDAFGKNGTIRYLMASDARVLSLDPGAGMTHPGFPISDLFKANFSPSATFCTWHCDGNDEGLFVADGSTGWHRMISNIAPEVGYAWSVKANITGGCSAVQSVEVSPGTKRLLVGPAASGPILQRDSTVNKDNGTAFVWNVAFGSLVLAQPGQVAEVDFVTADSGRTGARPTIGVLLGETSGTFETLYRSTNDPPLLPASKTLYNDRYYFRQNQEPVYCRHMQIQFNWAAEDAHNELLAYTLFGAVHNERKAQ